MKYVFHQDAETEFIETALYYEKDVPGLGERFGVEVRRAIEMLLEHPAMDCSRRRGAARACLGSLPILADLQHRDRHPAASRQTSCKLLPSRIRVAAQVIGGRGRIANMPLMDGLAPVTLMKKRNADAGQRL